MARNTPLGVVRSMVKAQSAKSLQSSSTAQDTEINQIISDTQQGLADAYDFPFLKNRWTLNIAPTTRFVNFPTQDDLGNYVVPRFERPGNFFLKWNQIWMDIVYGIDEVPEFNYLDSDRNQVLDPIQRWQFADENQFEVWPLPASTSEVRYVGQRALTPLSNYTYSSSGGDSEAGMNVTLTWSVTSGQVGLYYVANPNVNAYLHFDTPTGTWLINGNANIYDLGTPTVTIYSPYYTATSITGPWAIGASGAVISPTPLVSPPTFILATQNSWNDSATLDLDDLLVSLFAAGEYLTRKKSASAGGVLQAAQRKLLSILGAYPTRTETYCIGRGQPLDHKTIRQIPLVMVAGNTH
jgi:hypothetical protein